jgi:hypothetical protein
LRRGLHQQLKLKYRWKYQQFLNRLQFHLRHLTRQQR